MKILALIAAVWAATGLTQLLLLAAAKWIARRDLMAAPAAGSITIGGKTYKVAPLTMDRMDELLALLSRGLDPDAPYTVPRTAETMISVITWAAPKVPRRNLRTASGAELAAAFGHILDLYKLGGR